MLANIFKSLHSVIKSHDSMGLIIMCLVDFDCFAFCGRDLCWVWGWLLLYVADYIYWIIIHIYNYAEKLDTKDWKYIAWAA